MRNRVDWKNHIIGFIATIIGIIIGLNLDDWRNEKETHRRVHDFTVLIDDEIHKNIAALDTLLNNSNKHELQLKFLISKNIDDKNIVHCTQRELDSVKRVWFPYPFLINYDKIDDGKFRVYFALSDFGYDNQSTVWESFKNTDLINNLEAAEITKYSRIYLTLAKESKSINQKKEQMMKFMDDRRIEKSLASLSLKDYLKKLSDMLADENMGVDQRLAMLKKEMGTSHKRKYPEMDIEKLKESKESFK